MSELSFAKEEITLAAASSLVEQALAVGRAKGLPIAVAVVDSGGRLKAFGRDDSCLFLPAEVAINKAWTAASFGYPTDAWNALIADANIAPLANHPRLIAVGGGYPLKTGGNVVGGLGISGGSYADDMEIAKEAMRCVGFETV